MAEEAAISRLYSGIHYRSDNEVGFKVGTRVGQVAVGFTRCQRRNSQVVGARRAVR
jgi:hypothetical protein